jgi:acyl-CoA thioesterase-1
MRRLLYLLPFALLACQDGGQSEDEGSRAEKNRPRILFLGNNLTAGQGVALDETFTAAIERKLDSAGLAYEVMNAGVSGETSAETRDRAAWLLRDPVEVLVIETGLNDGLRGIEPDATRRNIQEIIDLAQTYSPRVRIVIAGVPIPRHLGPDYAAGMSALYRELAIINQTAYVSDLMAPLSGRYEWLLADRFYPSPEGHERIAALLWTTIRELI